jgi:hypothetical protein
MMLAFAVEDGSTDLVDSLGSPGSGSKITGRQQTSASVYAEVHPNLPCLRVRKAAIITANTLVLLATV